MVDVYTMQGPPVPPGGRPPEGGAPASIVINNIPPRQPWLGRTFIRLLLFISILANIALFAMIGTYYQGITHREQFVSGDLTSNDKIAIIEVTGMINEKAVESPIKELEFAAKDKDVKSIILRVNSPGGEVFSTERLYRAILKYKEDAKKPVIVMMDGIAASGAFWISMPADKIFATKNTITGSIGVIMQTFVLTGLMKEWGVEPMTFKTGALKDTGSMFREMTEEDKAEIKKLMDGWYNEFLHVILTNRGEKVGGEEKLRQVADGRVVLGEEAKTLGFIDELGFMDNAIESAKELGKITGKARVVKYQRQSTFFELLNAKRDVSTLISRESLVDLQMPRFLAMPSSFLAASSSVESK